MEKKENIQEIITENLIYYRKKADLTQSELASKIAYSDKSISKWERGDGLPDILVLAELAKLYGLTVNDFLNKRKKEKLANRYFSTVMITLMAISLVWVIATLSFFLLSFFFKDAVANNFKPWLCFIYAIPTCFIVWTIFNDIYFKRKLNIISVSGICWTTVLAIYLSFIDKEGLDLLFIVAIPIEVVIILFYLFLLKKKRNHKAN